MNKIAMAVHGGAGPDDNFIKENIPAYEAGLRVALTEGYKIVRKGGSAVDAV